MKQTKVETAATVTQSEAFSGVTQVSRSLLSDHIVDQIGGLISRGRLKPGDRIPSEKQLCQQFGVGRTSVREALRSLAMIGVVESRMGEGTFVIQDTGRILERSFQWGLLLDPKDVEDLVETRFMLESHIAYLAATKATLADVKQLEGIVRLMEQTVSEPEQYLEHDLRFHLTIAEACHNSILLSLVSTTRAHLRAYIREALAASATGSGMPDRRAKLSVTEHKRVLKAIKDGDADAARQAMAAHILSARAEVRKQVATHPPSDRRPRHV